jgi:hypothetical protein
LVARTIAAVSAGAAFSNALTPEEPAFNPMLMIRFG